MTAEPRPVTAQLEAKRQQLDEIVEKLSILQTTVRSAGCRVSCVCYRHVPSMPCCAAGERPGDLSD